MREMRCVVGVRQEHGRGVGGQHANFYVLLARMFGSATYFVTTVTPQDQENKFSERA